ncbi:MAG TPA: RidA family protein [Sphingomonas sp.]|nr:RidA family protein [Sphingomonas sp.]
MRRLASLAVLLSLAAPVSANAQRDPAQVLMPPPEYRSGNEQWGYSEAITHGDTIYLSGVVAWLRPGETDQSVAFERAFRQIENVLKRAGSNWDNVIDMTTYHTDLPAQLDPFVKVKARYVTAPYPTWTAIDVDRLVPDTGLVEIKVVAKKAK